MSRKGAKRMMRLKKKYEARKIDWVEKQEGERAIINGERYLWDPEEEKFKKEEK